MASFWWACREFPVLNIHSSAYELFSMNQILSKGQDFDQRLIQLEKKVNELEAENKRLKIRIQEVENVNQTMIHSGVSTVIPKSEAEKKKFYETFQRELKSNQDRNLGPWTKSDSWKKVRRRMSEYSVREILGKPTRMKPSVNPAIEKVYLYTGDLNADGVEEQGLVNFKDKRVVSFQSPHE